jgi:pyruvate formate lyase activating enzyme
VWVEVTTLIIPGLNDTDNEIRGIADFIAGVDPDIAWHVSAFRPTYKMLDRPPTPAARLHSAREIGLQAGLRYVYVGNLRDTGGEDTRCPSCAATVISRRGFQVYQNRLTPAGACPDCDQPIAGVWQ